MQSTVSGIFKKYIYLILLLISTCFIINFSFSILISSLILSYIIIRHLVDRSIFNSWLLISITSVFFYAVMMQCVILCVWLINRNFPLDATIYITFAILILIYSHIHLIIQPSTTHKVSTPSTHIHDILSIATGLIILTVIILPPNIKGEWGEKSNILAYVNASIDDGHHIELLNDRLQFNRGVIYHSNAASNVRTSGSVSAYPVGWHAVNAVIIKSINPKISTGIDSIVAYVLTKFFWYTILVLLFVRFSFTIFGFFYKKADSVLINTWVTVASTLFAFFFLIAPFRQGFYSFIPQLIAMLLLSLALLQVVKSRNSRTRTKSITLASIICVGGSLPWILLLPAFALSLLSIIILTAEKNNHIKKTISSIYKSIINYPLIYTLLVLSLLLQLYLMAASDSAISFIESITIQGPIEVYSGEFYASIFIGLVCLILLSSKASAKYLRTLIIVMSSVLIVTALIGLIQFYKLYDFTYYYYKSLNVFTVAAIPMAIVGYGITLQYLYKKDRILSYIVVFFLILLSVQFVGPNPGYPNGLIGQNTHGKLGRELIDYTKFHRPISYSVNKHIYASLLKFQDSYFNKTIPIYYSQGVVSQNEVASLMLKTNLPASSCMHKIHGSLYRSDTIKVLLKYIDEACSAEYHIIIFVDRNQIQNSLNSVKQMNMKNISILPN